jgi:predicted metal-binding transcription factor (methanogenesis marker protein 9)
MKPHTLCMGCLVWCSGQVKPLPDCALRYARYKSDIYLQAMNVEQSDRQMAQGRGLCVGFGL